MAAGDMHWFVQGLLDLGNKIHDLDTDEFRYALVTSVTTPTTTTAGPHYGGTGTTNFASNAVATGTSWTGPVVLASPSWVAVSNVATLRFTDPAQIAQDAGGFTNARWAIVYNNTDANKRAIGFIDLGSDRSIVSGPLQIDFGGAGTDAFRLTAN